MQPNQPHAPYAQSPANPYANPYPNPYAPPAPAPALYRQNVFVPQGAVAGPLVGPTLRKVKLAIGIAQVVSLVVGVVFFVTGAVMNDDTGAVLAIIGGATLGLWYLLLFGYAIANMMWLYRFWSWIPPEQRHTNMWKKYISPGTAVGFMFIPYFNIYWMFVIYLGLSDIMERMRVQFPSSKGSVKTLAILTIVIPMVFFPAGPFLQYMLAKHLEEMAKEMSARMVGGPLPA